MPVIDFETMRKWSRIPKNIQDMLIRNVFCTNCGVTTIVEYTIKNDRLGILLEGKCKKCGKAVVRFIEDE